MVIWEVSLIEIHKLCFRLGTNEQTGSYDFWVLKNLEITNKKRLCLLAIIIWRNWQNKWSNSQVTVSEGGQTRAIKHIV